MPLNKETKPNQETQKKDCMSWKLIQQLKKH